MKSRSSAEETECSCNHLTHFAVLFDYSDANSLYLGSEAVVVEVTWIDTALAGRQI